MMRSKVGTWFAAFLGGLFVYAGSAHAIDIHGEIDSTLIVTDDSQLVDDVTCKVNGDPCIRIGAPGVTLELNGFTMTGQGDAQTGCNGGPSAFDPQHLEDGIDLQGQTDVTIHGPGLIRQFRGPGIFANQNIGLKVTGVTVSTNCLSGILVGGGSGHHLSGNVSVRNGNGNFPCGGIWLYGGASRSRLRANRLFGNGYAAQGGNFGIGLLGGSPATHDNVVEDNIVSGNTNGIRLGVGTHGHVLRRNIVVGNPPIQVSVGYPSTSGVDIKNEDTTGANTFRDNVCLTSVNAPCPAIGRRGHHDDRDGDDDTQRSPR